MPLSLTPLFLAPSAVFGCADHWDSTLSSSQNVSDGMHFTWMGNNYNWKYLLVPICVSIGLMLLCAGVNFVLLRWVKIWKRPAVKGFIAPATHPDLICLAGTGERPGQAPGAWVLGAQAPGVMEQAVPRAQAHAEVAAAAGRSPAPGEQRRPSPARGERLCRSDQHRRWEGSCRKEGPGQSAHASPTPRMPPSCADESDESSEDLKKGAPAEAGEASGSVDGDAAAGEGAAGRAAGVQPRVQREVMPLEKEEIPLGVLRVP